MSIDEDRINGNVQGIETVLDNIHDHIVEMEKADATALQLTRLYGARDFGIDILAPDAQTKIDHLVTMMCDAGVLLPKQHATPVAVYRERLAGMMREFTDRQIQGAASDY